MRLVRNLVTLTAVMALAVATQTARADIAVSFVSVTGSGPFTWTYSAALQPSSEVTSTPIPNPDNTTNFFTIYDFQGFTGTHSEPAGWTFTTALVGPTPATTSPSDSATVPNLTWTYTAVTENEGSPSAQTPLGTFSAGSIYGQIATLRLPYAAATQSAPTAGGDSETDEPDAN